MALELHPRQHLPDRDTCWTTRLQAATQLKMCLLPLCRVSLMAAL